MKIMKFDCNRDLALLEGFLRAQYFTHCNAFSWLPERLHDLIYRIAALETGEGRKKSSDYIFLWEDGGEIFACVLPDGENIYISIKDGFEQIFPSMIAFSEENCRPLFTEAEDGSVRFWVAADDSFPYMRKALVKLGYTEYSEKEYMNCVYPLNTDVRIELPNGFRFLYGEAYPDEKVKWSALRLGFHPDWESENYSENYTICMDPYNERKKSSLYPDCFECITVDENAVEDNNISSYCFVYVDRKTQTALIEPVSTREEYRRRGLGKAMIHGAIQRCKKLGIEKCYVDSFGWRRDFYTAAGFFTASSHSFWYKSLG